MASSKVYSLRLPISINNYPSSRKRTTLRVNLLRPLIHKSQIFHTKPPFLPTRIFPINCNSKTADHHHHHDHDHNHNHHHHGHHHHHNGGELELTKSQKAFADFVKAIKWTDLADFLREHLELCCFSTALFLAAAVCPYLIPKASAKPIQQVLALVDFPLVGISASFDALLDITGGKVNIHVLMALAAFASAFMGNSLEGGLLLAMFNLAHIAEELLIFCSSSIHLLCFVSQASYTNNNHKNPYNISVCVCVCLLEKIRNRNIYI